MPYRWLILLLLPAFHICVASCIGPINVCSSFDGSNVVFRGRVLEAKLVSTEPRTVTHPDGTSTLNLTGFVSETVRLQVLEVFKGTAPLNGEFMVSASQGRFEAGKEYVVFASFLGKSQELAAGVCSRTHLLEDPADPDLAWLRAYPSAPPTGFIFGSLRGVYGAGQPLPEGTVTLAGPVSRSAAADANGAYAFRDLPPGEYTVTAVLPAGLVTDKPSTLRLAPKSCAEVDWYIHHNATISGRVTDTAGNPAAGTVVGLLQPDDGRSGYRGVTFVQADAEGRYEFSRLEPGSYWVAVHLFGATRNDPHPASFYPAEPTLKSAKLLSVDASTRLTGVDLIAADALRPVTVHLRVVDEKGGPVVQGHIIALDDLTTGSTLGNDLIGPDGRTDIQMFEGRTYTLVADDVGYHKPACAGPVRFVARDGLTLPTLTLSKSWHQCRTEQHAYEKPLTER